jgi:hypothetical protein
MTRDVLLAETVAEQLAAWSNAAAPYETGGILLGVLGDDRPWVMSAAQVPSAAPRRSAYELPAGVTRPIVLHARETDPRVGYLGDWHSHPADSKASLTDLATYKRAVRFARLRSEQAPLLVVVRHGPEGWVPDVMATRSWWRAATPVAFMLTGPPPALESH